MWLPRGHLRASELSRDLPSRPSKEGWGLLAKEAGMLWPQVPAHMTKSAPEQGRWARGALA